MGYKFHDVKENSHIVLTLRLNEKQMSLGATVDKHIGPNLTQISIDYPNTKRLIFDNVQIDVLYCSGDTSPIIWHSVKIVHHKNVYILQVLSDGAKSNRRNSFRVSVAALGWMTQIGKKPQQVMVKDVSITGFALTDRKKELDLSSGSRVTVTFEDLMFKITMDGQVVRIEKHEEYIVYGFMLLNVCKDLPAYVNLKQTKNLRKKNS